MFAALTGMRRGELCGLRWSDIDEETATVTVRRSVWQVRSEWGLKDTKSHRVRPFSLDPLAESVLTARRGRAIAEAETAGIELPADGFVWSTFVDGHAPRREQHHLRPSIACAGRWRTKPGRSPAERRGVVLHVPWAPPLQRH